MGRQGAPLADLGNDRTRTPPRSEQGTSNRANGETEGQEMDAVRDDEDDTDQGAAPYDTGENTDYVAGGDQSNRAAHSGATGERHPGGGKNKPEPKNRDEKAAAGGRNNTDRNR